MTTVWRLVTARFAVGAFSGERARLHGGRWNRKGVPLIYTAASQSLAMLEMLVQDEPLRARYVIIPAHIPKGLKIMRIKPEQLPSDWRTIPAQTQLQEIGGAWALEQSAAALAVPSVVIPDECNYLLNPRHPHFGKIEIGEPQAFITDVRLSRK